MTNLHKEFPLTKQKLSYIITDIIRLYPEADKIYIVGTYARINERPLNKPHDVDILIHFSAKTNRRDIELRNDDALWNKWSNAKSKIIIDFLFMFGNEESKYGKHIWRRDNNLKTPKLLVWRR